MKDQDLRDLLDHLRLIGISPNECDSNGEPANAVDGLYRISRAIGDLAAAIREHTRSQKVARALVDAGWTPPPGWEPPPDPPEVP